jgi:predicted O-methyltransferase YrrM
MRGWRLFGYVARRSPFLKRVMADRDHLRQQNQGLTDKVERLHLELTGLQRSLHVPPGHFYSPIPDFEEILELDGYFDRFPEGLPGIDLNDAQQLQLMESFQAFYPEMPFTAERSDGLRYYFNNGQYEYSDAIILYSMLRYLRPKKIIEVGSGFSSAVILDTNDLFLNSEVQCTFVEPYPQTLETVLSTEGTKPAADLTILEMRLQDVDQEIFLTLGPNDVLFIDSTHVSKAASDVNRLVLEILPLLQEGVYVHFHDIFYPFEYPRPWFEEMRAWNEAYLLRAFLEFNSAFDIVFFSTYLEQRYRSKFEEHMPLCLVNPGGSIWLRKRS